MKKDHEIFLKHILESIKLIEEYTKRKTKDDFSGLDEGEKAIIR